MGRLHARLTGTDPTVPHPHIVEAFAIINADEHVDARSVDDFEARQSAWTVEFGADLDAEFPWVRETDAIATTDAGGTSVGWDLDDIAFAGVEETPFTEVTLEDGLCVDTLPVAHAGVSLTVNEREDVTLDGSSSSNPWGEPLSFDWTQASGPAVGLAPSGATATFTAPDVDTSSTLSFALSVSDSARTSEPDTVEVTVLPLNEAPRADIQVPATATSGAQVTLDGSASADPDGDELIYFWTQLDGPPVAITEATSATAGFTVPRVEASTELRFRLVVSDGRLLSEAVQAAIAIEVMELGPDAMGDLGESPGDGVLGGSGCTCATVVAASQVGGWRALLVGVFGLLLWRRRQP